MKTGSSYQFKETEAEISQATGFCAAYVSQLVKKCRDHGLEAISGNHYDGDHLNMGKEAEPKILEPFKARAEKGGRNQ